MVSVFQNEAKLKFVHFTHPQPPVQQYRGKMCPHRLAPAQDVLRASTRTATTCCIAIADYQQATAPRSGDKTALSDTSPTTSAAPLAVHL